LVLSDGHYNHIISAEWDFFRAADGTLKPGTPFVVGGEECFCARRWTSPPLAGSFGALDRSAIEVVRLTVVDPLRRRFDCPVQAERKTRALRADGRRCFMIEELEAHLLLTEHVRADFSPDLDDGVARYVVAPRRRVNRLRI
jgi:hypothetical protein